MRERFTTRSSRGVSCVLTLAIALILGGCRQIVGIDDRQVAFQSACGIDFLAGDCQACAQAKCCDAATQCAGSAECADLENCFGLCSVGDSACRSRCARQHPVPDDMQMAGALDACLAQQCAGSNSCSIQCGGLSTLAEPDAAAACSACMNMDLDGFCDAGTQCGVSPDCQTYVHCRQACWTGDCFGACADSNADGRSLYNTLWEPNGSCGVACGVTADWGCVGDGIVTHAPPLQGVPTLTVSFVYWLTSTPIVGMSVAMCGGAPDCSTPVDTGVTDDAGAVTLTDYLIDPGQAGLQGFFELSSNQIYPTIVYWGFPLSSANGRFDTPIDVLTPSEVSLVLGQIGLEPGKGVVVVAALDCQGALAPNVTIQSGFNDAGASTYYIAKSNVPSSELDATTSVGLAVIVNVPVGYVDLFVTPSGLGTPSSILTVYVPANMVTEVSMAPNQ